MTYQTAVDTFWRVLCSLKGACRAVLFLSVVLGPSAVVNASPPVVDFRPTHQAEYIQTTTDDASRGQSPSEGQSVASQAPVGMNAPDQENADDAGSGQSVEMNVPDQKTANDASGGQSSGEEKLAGSNAPVGMNASDPKTTGVSQKHQTRGIRRKETVQPNPEKIPVEGQKDLIDIMKPRN